MNGQGEKKMYANIIRQIENGLADWSKDFSEIETPILIKYIYIYMLKLKLRIKGLFSLEKT
jgi:hypothetical protein